VGVRGGGAGGGWGGSSAGGGGGGGGGGSGTAPCPLAGSHNQIGSTIPKKRERGEKNTQDAMEKVSKGETQIAVLSQTHWGVEWQRS